MNNIQLDSIGERLAHLPFSELPLLFGTHALGPGRPLDRIRFGRAIDALSSRHDELLESFPALREVRDWVQVFWSPEREVKPPADMIFWEGFREVQPKPPLDSNTATIKLFLAAAGYGAERVADVAMDFAERGVIEVHQLFLLKGTPPAKMVELDPYCRLVPYKDILVSAEVTAMREDNLPGTGIHWPPEEASEVFALQVTKYHEGGETGVVGGRYESPLFRCGIDSFLHLLGLVRGYGARLFFFINYVTGLVASALPYQYIAAGGGGANQISIDLPGFGRDPTTRPINVRELAGLIEAWVALSDRDRRVLSLALRRLQDSTERVNSEDKAVDLAVALEAAFVTHGKNRRRESPVPDRASWYFADSLAEKRQARRLLSEFYNYRNSVVHGEPEVAAPGNEGEKHGATLDAVDDLVRTCLKNMVLEGRPEDWKTTIGTRPLRYDPPRACTEIRSIKSDSLSWTRAEQQSIDEALGAVWKPEVDAAPELGANAAGWSDIDAEEIKQCRRENIPFTVIVPARLYFAHPMWPCIGDEVDDRTRYYCSLDIRRHLHEWGKAAARKGLRVFQVRVNDPAVYLSDALDHWLGKLRRMGIDI